MRYHLSCVEESHDEVPVWIKSAWIKLATHTYSSKAKNRRIGRQIRSPGHHETTPQPQLKPLQSCLHLKTKQCLRPELNSDIYGGENPHVQRGVEEFIQENLLSRHLLPRMEGRGKSPASLERSQKLISSCQSEISSDWSLFATRFLQRTTEGPR